MLNLIIVSVISLKSPECALYRTSGLKTEMLMPKKNRIAIYELLFKEGVMVAKKDVHLAKHPELADKNVPNLHVMKAMQFAWRHFYWYLTNEGIQYLRDFLHLPPEIVPATLRRQTRPETARPRPKGKRKVPFEGKSVHSAPIFATHLGSDFTHPRSSPIQMNAGILKSQKPPAELTLKLHISNWQPNQK
uniref:Ribosomal protein S10 n=1 Tax=Cyprinus carpio carpio TaxID=630221 RepID=A0A9J7ZAS8_CYPCA